MKNIKKYAIGLGIIFFLWLAASYGGSHYATRTRSYELPPGSQVFSRTVEEVELETIDRVKIIAWWIPVDSSERSVILLNGIGANRSTMVDRARLYLDQDFNVLMPDLRGTGESGGELITFGWKERLDLMACYLYLQGKGFESIGVHGNSLGGAAIAYSLELKPEFSFVVLESPYDNIENALNNRLKTYRIPRFLVSAMIFITEGRIEADMEQLNPELCFRALTVPTLLMAGDNERKVKKSETENIFKRINTSDKQLHFFRGARHEDFLRNYKKEYEQVLIQWLKTLNVKSM